MHNVDDVISVVFCVFFLKKWVIGLYYIVYFWNKEKSISLCPWRRSLCRTTLHLFVVGSGLSLPKSNLIFKFEREWILVRKFSSFLWLETITRQFIGGNQYYVHGKGMWCVEGWERRDVTHKLPFIYNLLSSWSVSSLKFCTFWYFRPWRYWFYHQREFRSRTRPDATHTLFTYYHRLAVTD